MQAVAGMSPGISWMLQIVMWVLLLLIGLSALRMVLGPTSWDRLLGFSQLSALCIPFLVLMAILYGLDYLLDIAITYALLGFIGTLFMARFIRRRGKEEAS